MEDYVEIDGHFIHKYDIPLIKEEEFSAKIIKFGVWLGIIILIVIVAIFWESRIGDFSMQSQYVSTGPVEAYSIDIITKRPVSEVLLISKSEKASLMALQLCSVYDGILGSADFVAPINIKNIIFPDPYFSGEITIKLYNETKNVIWQYAGILTPQQLITL